VPRACGVFPRIEEPRASSSSGTETRPLPSDGDNGRCSFGPWPRFGRFDARTAKRSSNGAPGSEASCSRRAPGGCARCMARSGRRSGSPTEWSATAAIRVGRRAGVSSAGERLFVGRSEAATSAAWASCGARVNLLRRRSRLPRLLGRRQASSPKTSTGARLFRARLLSPSKTPSPGPGPSSGSSV